jgi:hypothetical protein
MARSLTLSLCLALAACHADGPCGFGRPATAGEIARRDLTVFPDGTGLPPGHGSAREGRAIFAAQCAACHGARGEGRDDYPPLVGGIGSLGTSHPLLTVGSYWPQATTVFDYIRRAMPYVAPGSLEPDEVYALTAFVLRENGLTTEDQILDQRSLPMVRMPNRDGFVGDPRPDVR